MIEKILEQYGTPCYVFDKEILNERISYLKEKLNPIHFCFAVKANPFLIREMPEVIERLEVCSPGEYRICESLKIDSRRLVISGVFKEKVKIEELIKKDIGYYTIESMSQLELLNKLSKKHQKSISVLIRLTSGNQFGVSEDEVYWIIEHREEYSYLKFCGIEYFSGTQKHSIKRLTKEIDYLKEIVDKVKKEYSYTFEEIEFGPGLPVFYYNEEFDEDSFLDELKHLLLVFQDMHITLELGRSIVASCGSYYTKVVDKKKNNVGNYAIVDGGMHQMVYYGGSLALKIPKYEILPNKQEGVEESWNICGSLCTINDILVKQLKIKHLEIGDILCFKNTGAYAMTEGISLFLSRDLPSVLLKNKDEVQVLRDSCEIAELNTPHYKKENDYGKIN